MPGQSGTNTCKNWLRENDLWGRRSWEKFVPDWFLERADDRSIAELLGGMFDTDGSVIRRPDGSISLKYTTTSQKMAGQVVWALQRVGIIAHVDSVGYLSALAKHPIFTVSILEGMEIARFKAAVVLLGRKGRRLLEAQLSTAGSKRLDRLGAWVGTRLLELAREQGFSQAGFGYRDQGKRISQRNLARHMAKIRPTDDIRWLVNDNLFWDRLKSISPIGREQVLDPNPRDNGILLRSGATICLRLSAQPCCN